MKLTKYLASILYFES